MQVSVDEGTVSPLSSEEERARKRRSIGLSARRPTARETVQRPPDQSAGDGRMWLAVLLLCAMILATGWMVYDSVRAVPEAVAVHEQAPDPLLQDDFNAPQLALASTRLDGVWETGFVDGGYQIRIEQPGQLTWSTLGLLDLNTYRVETELILGSSEAEGGAQTASWGYGGLLARYGNKDNFYLFVVDGRGAYQVQLQKEEVWRVLQPWIPSAVLNPIGETNRLAIEDDGSQLRFFANGALLFTVDAPKLPSGDAGLVGGTRSQGTLSARFDWTKVYAVPLAAR